VHAVRRNRAFLHPWLEAASDAPTGKIWHTITTHLPQDENPLTQPNDPDYVMPLYSQPLLEACTRIPLYLLTQGGNDRALARRAFQHSVPKEIIRRRTKGGLEEHVKSIIKCNLRVVRELLVDGQLVRERVLDRATLAKMLSPGGVGIGTGPAELMEYVIAEMWLQNWRAAAQSSARPAIVRN
jgi:asparagine synthase (glutamine-hydrolysing)